MKHPDTVNDVTQILEAARMGDVKAGDRLLSLVYHELRALARIRMAKEAAGNTLQPTALVHEAWMRLLNPDERMRFQNRAHFFSAAAAAMRRILVESARRRKRVKHGGHLQQVPIDLVEVPLPTPEDKLIALDAALDELTGVHADAAEVVKLCYFVGLTHEQTAKELGVSLRTVERLWAFARAWLSVEIKRSMSTLA